MNDYEINLRLAEIVGFDWAELDGRFQYARLDHPEFGSMWGHEWSPLTNWGQLGPLVESTSEMRVFNTTRRRYRASCFMPNRSTGGIGIDTNKMKAICLAIIGAHENEG